MIYKNICSSCWLQIMGHQTLCEQLPDLYSCKQWKEFAEDADILETVNFGSTHKIDESFWKKNGFLNKCANANNKRASRIIARKKMEKKIRQMMQLLKGVQKTPYVPESIKELRRTDTLFFPYKI
ncbi:uncharacterized protein LOC141673440 isoform X3 [Apium graveolens]